VIYNPAKTLHSSNLNLVKIIRNNKNDTIIQKCEFVVKCG